MIKIAEWLLMIGTLLLIITGFLVNIIVGIGLTGIACVTWGTLLLKVGSLESLKKVGRG
ncbi:hypothetical protein [Ignavigranum ruoffiae]|uniref:hypothetical protein n=1 Tax=Ignavigranum ruoffiae TaxID=89093 RepID=UPI0023559D0D|nr:hypothetical protein [Ignavigranum ruoffiae]